MSRIGKLAIPVPSGVTVSIDGNNIKVKGPRGELARSLARLADDEGGALRGRLCAAQPHEVMISLGGNASERAQELREHWLSEHKARLRDNYELAHAAARSTHALDHEQAWEIRELAQATAPISSLSAIDGLTSERS